MVNEEAFKTAYDVCAGRYGRDKLDVLKTFADAYEEAKLLFPTAERCTCFVMGKDFATEIW